MSNKLIAFYSRAGNNYISGDIKTLDIGNTEVVANIINKLIDADLFKIEQEKAYSDDYNICTREAQEDQINGKRPTLKHYANSIDSYDEIYLGFPNYWGTMPMAVFTFLEHYDFSGKTIYPFCTHEGSRMGTSVEDIKRLCPKANVKAGLAIRGSEAYKSKEIIEKWIMN